MPVIEEMASHEAVHFLSEEVTGVEESESEDNQVPVPASRDSEHKVTVHENPSDVQVQEQEVASESSQGMMAAEKEIMMKFKLPEECRSLSGTRSNSNSKSRSSYVKSDSSENNSKSCQNNAIPCCRLRKCYCPDECPKDCPPGSERVYFDPCCCPCVPTPFVDNIKLKEENRELRRCIKNVRQCAMADACNIMKDVMDGCQCCCCKARKKLKPCKSNEKILCRETWMCVPMPGSSRCGGYTPSGWNKLLKKCRDLTGDPCATCDISSQVPVCCNKRCKCLPLPKPCPPCPHLCAARALPMGIRPYTPCCPLYFPNTTCTSSCYVPSTCCSSGSSYKCPTLPACCKSTITPPPYKPMYTGTGSCNGDSALMVAEQALTNAQEVAKSEIATPVKEESQSR